LLKVNLYICKKYILTLNVSTLFQDSLKREDKLHLYNSFILILNSYSLYFFLFLFIVFLSIRKKNNKVIPKILSKQPFKYHYSKEKAMLCCCFTYSSLVICLIQDSYNPSFTRTGAGHGSYPFINANPRFYKRRGMYFSTLILK